MRSPRFLTLTLTKKVSVHVNIKRIWTMRKALFRKLRDSGYRIGSWCAVVELPNHIHLVIDSDYIPQSEVSSIWKTLTGDSYIVDIRRRESLQRDPRRAVHYLAKYLTKMSSWRGINLDLLEGFHLIGSYALHQRLAKHLKCPECGNLQGYRKIPLDGYEAILSSMHPPPLNDD